MTPPQQRRPARVWDCRDRAAIPGLLTRRPSTSSPGASRGCTSQTRDGSLPRHRSYRRRRTVLSACCVAVSGSDGELAGPGTDLDVVPALDLVVIWASPIGLPPGGP